MALVEVARDGGVATITLNDPDRRNAMSVAMGEALHDAFTDLARDEDLRVAVLTGAPPAFCAGGDLGMLEEHARRTRDEGYDATADMRRFYGRFLSVRELPVPVIAAVNGHAIGAGLCVAMACDLLIVTEEAKVGLNFAQLGLHPGMAASWLLPRLVGRQRAADLLYTGRLISGAEARDIGLALDVLPTDEVLDHALERARRIAAASPVVVRQLKRSLTATWEHTLEEQLDVEAAAQAVNYGTVDLAEGLAAVREKRPSAF